MHIFESIASAYKPMHGNKISNEIKSQKSKSLKGSSLSKSQTSSVMDNYDADAVGAGRVQVDEEEPETPKLMSTGKKLNGSSDASSPLLDNN